MRGRTAKWLSGPEWACSPCAYLGVAPEKEAVIKEAGDDPVVTPQDSSSSDTKAHFLLKPCPLASS